MASMRTMLIVDDSKIDRAILANIFKDQYTILQAASGREALELLDRQKIDLVILDVQMDDIDGFGVLSSMRRDARLKDVPVVVSTSESAHEQLALIDGADDFVSKPLDPVVVKKRVDNIVTKYMLERERLESALQDKEEELDSLTDSIPGGICVAVYSPASGISLRYFNDSFNEIFGLTREEMEKSDGFAFVNLIYEEDLPEFRAISHKAKMNEPMSLEIRIKHADGQPRWVKFSVVKFRDAGNEQIFRGVLLDVTESKTNELLARERARELSFVSQHDPLTGLYNRDTFFTLVSKLVKEPVDAGYLVVQLDIERFKVLNELYGSDRGNAVLRGVATALNDCLGDVGISARMGSDLFGFVIPDDSVLLARVMDRVLEECDRVCPNYMFRICYGGYKVVDPTMSVDLMCDCANLARRSIKGVYGETYSLFSEEMHQSLLNEQRLLDEGEVALSANQFEIYFQPIYDLRTEKLSSAEALVRWRHPVRGLVPPNEFIPVFENSGFIVRLDRYVRERVGKFIGSLNKAGVECPPISVNFSRLDLSDPTLVSSVERLVLEYGVVKSQFRIEVTESAFAKDEYQMTTVINELRSRGFTLLMDDFGTGLSSLGMLRDIPVDVLKLDMRFLDDEADNDRGRKVLGSIIPLANALDLRVIAEGVETDQQVMYLRSIGCDYAQGYCYARPMPADDFYKLLTEGVA